MTTTNKPVKEIQTTIDYLNLRRKDAGDVIAEYTRTVRFLQAIIDEQQFPKLRLEEDQTDE